MPVSPHANHGGILIEFAFSIPILISLLFFLCDHYHFYELKNKLRSSAYLAASMVQNISNTRTDKQLTSMDLARISYASCLNLFHTNTMFNPWSFSIFFAIDFDYVKRVSENEYYYERNWGTTDSGDSPQNMFRGKDTYNTSNVKYTKSQVASIYPDLVCNKDGEEKLLISCYYRNAPTGVDNSKLGFFILNFPKIDWYSFSYKILITPKPGLFPTKW